MEMDRHWIIFTIVLIGLSIVKSQTVTPANVQVRELAAKVGQSANMSCSSHGVPILVCIWERPNKTLTINMDSSRQGTTSDRGYTFTGPGFEQGGCGLQITKVTEEDNAVWNCKLISAIGNVYQGSIRLDILKAPQALQFAPNSNTLKNLIDAEPRAMVNVTCGSYGGQPDPKYKWFIGEDEITEGLLPYENQTEASSGHHWTYQTLAGYHYAPKDNGKNLRCVLVHEALDKNEVKEVVQKITVYYSPRAETKPSAVFIPKLGEDAILSINISSNPKPKILWNAAGVSINPPFTTPDKKYTAFNLVDRSNGLWEATLTIRNVEEEDLAKVYKFEASNLYGKESFDLQITSSDPQAGGISAGGIVGLVLGIPLILILIAVIVVYTRARGLLCFKGDDGTASEKERMDGESGGAGAAAEEKEKPAPLRFSARLSAIYENLVSKKKDKTAPVEEELTKEKEIDKENAEKKPDDIVYAELDLVNETGGKQVVRCADDKTEYAEIVGVVPQGGKIEDSKKEKSPTGSKNPSPKK